jgi:hypothetical protein
MLLCQCRAGLVRCRVSMIKDSDTAGKVVSAECPRCKVGTNHKVERAVEWSDSDDQEGVSVWETFQIIRCGGCDTISFRSVSGNSEDYHYDSNGNIEHDERIRLYPDRPEKSVVGELFLREEVYKVPAVIQSIYGETLAATEQSLPTLAGIGVRAVIEAMCSDLKAKGRDLEAKIDKLESMSLLTSEGAKILHGIRLLGNKAAHRMEAPSAQQLRAALRVIDHLLLGAYVIPHEAKILPQHTAKPKSGSTNSATTPIVPTAAKSAAQAQEKHAN